ncbi:hypothetical protein [Orenia marismortui]|uniref:Solute:sodium symporter small subunit n=1 Tax=Orenia marismortui TaxID=46469 RepID=A0A4R8H8G2_9FIRM|nr:hypothetical protein [Orenia marismortui]TDX52082.1 hypothetical protein C7959_1084 [Orenia marismortui]
MNEEEKRKWEQIKARGKLHYILIHGILGWGFITALAYLFFTFIIKYGFDLSLLSSKDFLQELAISLIVFPIVGILQSLFAWNKKERIYSEERKKE